MRLGTIVPDRGDPGGTLLCGGVPLVSLAAQRHFFADSSSTPVDAGPALEDCRDATVCFAFPASRRPSKEIAAMSAPPPPPPDSPCPLLNPPALDELLARDPERAAALLRLLPGEAYVTQAERHAALVGVPLMRILAEWGELFELTATPRKAPPRPRTPRRWPSINPHVPKRPPPTPHHPGDGRRKKWPRIRMRALRSPAWV